MCRANFSSRMLILMLKSLKVELTLSKLGNITWVVQRIKIHGLCVYPACIVNVFCLIFSIHRDTLKYTQNTCISMSRWNTCTTRRNTLEYVCFTIRTKYVWNTNMKWNTCISPNTNGIRRNTLDRKHTHFG